jgi:hypothetical protein
MAEPIAVSPNKHDWQPVDSTGREIQCANCGVRNDGTTPLLRRCPAEIRCTQVRPNGLRCPQRARFAYLGTGSRYLAAICAFHVRDLAEAPGVVIVSLAGLSESDLISLRAGS